MKTTTLTTADGREIRVHHAEDWSGQARLRFAPDSNQGDIHLPGWVARGLCRREPQTTCVRSDCRGSKVCEAEGCQVIHPNGCSADRTLGGWLCGAHVGVPLEGLARVERDPQAPATLADLDALREEIAGALDAVTDRRRDWGDCNSDFDWLADAIRKGGAK